VNQKRSYCSPANVAGLAAALAAASSVVYQAVHRLGPADVDRDLFGFPGAALTIVVTGLVTWTAIKLRFPLAAPIMIALGFVFYRDWTDRSSLSMWGLVLFSFPFIARARLLGASAEDCARACAAASGWLLGVAGWLGLLSSLDSSPWAGLLPLLASLAFGVAAVLEQGRKPRATKSPESSGEAPPASRLARSFLGGLACMVLVVVLMLALLVWGMSQDSGLRRFQGPL
jgi:hypothetical protein